MQVLFVCLGNVARSQMAEAYFNYFSKEDKAISTGVLDFTPEKYGYPVKEAIEVMKEDGIDISKQKVTYINPEMVEKSDKIFVMCKKEECPDFLLNSNKVTFWKIEDPFNSSLDNFRKIRDEIKNKVLAIIR
jgi:arsenate reductase